MPYTIVNKMIFGADNRMTKSGKTTPDPIDINVGAMLFSLRCSRKMSQQQLGMRLGISFQQIQKYEKGTNRMAASTLYKASRVLDVSVIEFFAGLEGASPESQRARFSKEELELLRVFCQINHKEWRQCTLAIIKTIARSRPQEE
jgi:transcriptional regulator with XRE-family HTH domain